MNKDKANNIAQLVVNGIKTATCSGHIFYELENEPLPAISDYSIFLNSEDQPVAIIKTVEVTITSMNEVTEEFAMAEGEGDNSWDFIIVVYFHFFGYFKVDHPNSVKKVMEKANIKHSGMLATENVEEKVLVFYKGNMENRIGVALLDHNWLGYKFLSGSNDDSINMKDDLTWGYSNPFIGSEKQEDFPFVHGTINNDKVEKVTVDGDPAKIISKDPYRMWYILLNSNDSSGYDIKGYDNGGEVIYKSGV